jgi:hypothetical protein
LFPFTIVLNGWLENNHFGFNGKNYIQTEGTAIGSHLGMNYACTYLGEWEQELFEKSDRLPTHYWRYVDDVWGLWEHGLEKLREFHNLARWDPIAVPSV